METGLLIIRCALGGAMFLQGVAKLTRNGRSGATRYFDSIGFRPAVLLAVVAGVTEVGAGVLFGVGLATPLAAAGLIAVLVGAVAVKWGNGYWNTGDGYEYPLLVAFGAAGVAFTGPGEMSVDAHLGWADASIVAGVGAVVVGVVAAVPLLVRRAMVLGSRPAGTASPAEVV